MFGNISKNTQNPRSAETSPAPNFLGRIAARLGRLGGRRARIVTTSDHNAPTRPQPSYRQHSASLPSARRNFQSMEPTAPSPRSALPGENMQYHQNPLYESKSPHPADAPLRSLTPQPQWKDNPLYGNKLPPKGSVPLRSVLTKPPQKNEGSSHARGGATAHPRMPRPRMPRPPEATPELIPQPEGGYIPRQQSDQSRSQENIYEPILTRADGGIADSDTGNDTDTDSEADWQANSDIDTDTEVDWQAENNDIYAIPGGGTQKSQQPQLPSLKSHPGLQSSKNTDHDRIYEPIPFDLRSPSAASLLQEDSASVSRYASTESLYEDLRDDDVSSAQRSTSSQPPSLPPWPQQRARKPSSAQK